MSQIKCRVLENVFQNVSNNVLENVYNVSSNILGKQFQMFLMSTWNIVSHIHVGMNWYYSRPQTPPSKQEKDVGFAS